MTDGKYYGMHGSLPPSAAITGKHFTTKQIMVEIKGVFV